MLVGRDWQKLNNTAMRKNKRYLMVAAALATMTLSSCLFEEDDYFDKTPSKRIEAFDDDLANILTSAEKGWCVQYFPNDTTRGYNIMANFTASGVCHMACAFDRKLVSNADLGDLKVVYELTEENPNQYYREDTCLYEIKRQNGPVLAMTSYNTILSTFVEPAGDGLGLGGDDHLVLVSVSADEIQLKGERNGGRVYMVPATDEWKNELKARYEDYQHVFKRGITTFKLLAGNDALVCREGKGTGILQYGQLYVDKSGATSWIGVETAPFIMTANGIRFQKKFVRNEVSADVLNYNENRSALVSADGKVQIVPEYEAYLSSHDEVWQFDANSLQGDLLTTYQALSDAMKTSGFTGVKIGLGRATAMPTTGNKVWGLVAYGQRRVGRQTFTFTFVLGYDADVSQQQRIGLTLESVQRDKTYLDNIESASGSYRALYEPLNALAKALEGTYDVSVNDYFAPDTAIYKSTNVSFQINK